MKKNTVYATRSSEPGFGAGVGAAIGASWSNGFVARGVAAAVMAGVILVPGAVVGTGA